MKISLLTILISSLVVSVFAQSENDRRGFKGTLQSTVKQSVKWEGENAKTTDTTVESEILFDGRTIKIGNDVYDIVKREFDGEELTTFTCTKRRSTFTVTYKPGDYIRIVDQNNKTVETVYKDLTEN